MIAPDRNRDFKEALNENQGTLYGYIYSLLGDCHAASDVLQESNLILWKKVDEFRKGAPFLPWAFAIARFQVKAYLRDEKRKREVVLEMETVELLAAAAESHGSKYPQLEEALTSCLEKLGKEQKVLIRRRYFSGLGIRALAKELRRTESAVKVQLYRIRDVLRLCIQGELKSEEPATTKPQ